MNWIRTHILTCSYVILTCQYHILTCQYHILTCQYHIQTRLYVILTCSITYKHVSIGQYSHVSACILVIASLLLPTVSICFCLLPTIICTSSACSAVASPQGRCTGTFAARVAHAQADHRFHSNHVQHVQRLESAARHDSSSRRQQACSVAR